MNAILIKAKQELAEAATIASCIEDGVVTMKEIMALKFKGMYRELSLTPFVPTMADAQIKSFDELTEEEVAYINNKHEGISQELTKAAYEAALASYQLVFKMVSTVEDATVDLPSVPTKKALKDVKGVGPKLVEVLNVLGITKVEDLAAASPEALKEAIDKSDLKTPQFFSNKTAQYVEGAKSLLAAEATA